ncbi:hypothetical protein [Campylobacter gastrosuis]|uniref:Uncharacterized protein n=1 Tax=Campylobacter gastrosuis TaxID=2974576 RepID=A0ABT7HN97_9BACT|nr:hypothetical protein [Campylobacter gastrosuis]MDL0088130.1 hypothetical protein [Campylobacter gastrosuis]
MSKKDTSLEHIDPVKLLLFIFIFAIVCLVMIFAFIVPNIKEYRAINTQNRSQMASFAKVKQIYDTKSEALSSLKTNNQFILKSYETKFDKKKFIDFASKFFQNVSLNELEIENQNEEYFLYELNVTSSVKTPTNFYDFLDALSKYESIIKAEFPIKMKGDEKNIHTTFNIKVYGKKD